MVGVRGEVTVDNVTFSHDGARVISELSFHVPAGSICAILGPSGAGKSTLADLLVRFHDPLSGSVDGLTILESMRAHVEQHVLA